MVGDGNPRGFRTGEHAVIATRCGSPVIRCIEFFRSGSSLVRGFRLPRIIEHARSCPIKLTHSPFFLIGVAQIRSVEISDGRGGSGRLKRSYRLQE